MGVSHGLDGARGVDSARGHSAESTVQGEYEQHRAQLNDCAEGFVRDLERRVPSEYCSEQPAAFDRCSWKIKDSIRAGIPLIAGAGDCVRLSLVIAQSGLSDPHLVSQVTEAYTAIFTRIATDSKFGWPPAETRQRLCADVYQPLFDAVPDGNRAQMRRALEGIGGMVQGDSSFCSGGELLRRYDAAALRCDTVVDPITGIKYTDAAPAMALRRELGRQFTRVAEVRAAVFRSLGIAEPDASRADALSSMQGPKVEP